MTATADKLRHLLTAAGVEWTYADGTVRFDDSEHWFYVWTYSDGLMCVSMGYLTPEQAIAATVGPGTCEADETETIKCWVKCKDESSTEHVELIHVMECSECGHTYEHVNGDYEFCPRCGRKRVDA